MSIEIRFILCAFVALSLMALPAAAESWIIQSLTQEITEASSSGDIQSSIQIAGGLEGDIIIQDNFQHPRMNSDSTDRFLVIQIDTSPAQGYDNAELAEIAENLKGWDNASDIAYCNLDFQAAEWIKCDLDRSPNFGLEEILDDLNFSQRIFAQVDLLLPNTGCRFDDAQDCDLHPLLQWGQA